MPKVASEPVIARPLRAEAGVGRAGTRADGSFEALIDGSREAPRPARAERHERPRPEPRGEARAAEDRNAPRSEPTPDSSASDKAEGQTTANNGADKGEAKPAASPDPRQAKNGPPSDSAEAVVQAGVIVADAAAELAIAFTAAVEAATLPPDGEATPVGTEQVAETVSTDMPADGGEAVEVTISPAPDAQPAVAMVPPPAPQAAAQPVKMAADADIAATTPAALTPVPAAPMDGEPIAPQSAAAPKADHAAPAEPEAAPAPAAANEAAPAPAAPKDTKAAEPLAPVIAKQASPLRLPEAKATARPAGKTDGPATPKSDQPTISVPEDAKPPVETAPIPREPAEQPKTATPQPQAQFAEHATPATRSAPKEAAPDPITAPPAATQSAPPQAAAPIMPLSLAAHTTLSSMFPITALRVDAAAGNAVPVTGLAVEIVARAQDGQKRFEIRLDPPELGRIDVRLDVDNGGKVTSRLVIERADTLDLLRRDAHQLERALQHAGLNTEGGLEFSLRDQNFANRDQNARDGAAASRLIIPDDEPEAAEAARRGYGRLIGLGGGVDIRV